GSVLLLLISSIIFGLLAYLVMYPFLRGKRTRYLHEDFEMLKLETVRSDDNESLPPRLSAILQASILILLTWNLAVLPREARRYASEVKLNNVLDLGIARTISQITDPNDVIATNAIGALGWIADRKIFDIEGLVSATATMNRSKYGKEEGL